MDQKAMFYRAQESLAAADKLFLLFVKDGLTREQLAALIEKRPSLWGRYSHWLPKLPSERR